MDAELLLEIGTEEIPSGYLENGLNELKRLTEACLKENRIEVSGHINIYGTPRRLVLIGKGISERQENLETEMTGPPKEVAYDGNGKPTKAAFGFAKKQGVAVEDLKCISTPRGEYLYVKRNIPGRPTKDILADALPDIIARIPWPKSMRWGDIGFSFARPIHWVLALLNSQVIPFEIAGIKSSNMTRGHRIMAPHIREVDSVEEYLKVTRELFVIIDREEREKEVIKAAEEKATMAGGKPELDPDLVTTVANLAEFPSAVCGSFDRAFLDLPDSVLITPMKEHQKYFPVYDEKGRLMPNFIAVNNTVARDESVVRKGHERVLRARLSDAGFFFREDRKRKLVDRLEDLKGVIYQARLGTSFEKVMRFTELSRYLSEKLIPDKTGDVVLAATLCKCDLVTHMVTEFPSLQGIIGREYAIMDGHSAEVCNAISEHYYPLRAGDELPSSGIGAIVSIADRMDTITGCFAVGLEPSGNADPFALRRHSLAIIRIIQESGWDVSLYDFINKSLSFLADDIKFDKDAVFSRVLEFFRERYKQMMLRAGYESDLIEAIISTEFDSINALAFRIEQLKRFVAESGEFQALTSTFKRVKNILKKQQDAFEVLPDLFKETSEVNLWSAYNNIKNEFDNCMAGGKFYEALNLLAELREPVDVFFEGVEILSRDDEGLRRNRVGLLQYLERLFLRAADLSKISF
ncbi:MAG: glycine--tRNA ligase subunit beta [Deltaproteobacteria bacterium]|nr:glycine--tRNA ligase subunit beta [Deltaproteobacteria bacterium]